MKTPFRPLTQAITLARSEKPKQKIKKCTATLSLSLSLCIFFFFSISGHTNQSDSNRTRAAHTICLLSLCLSFILPTATTTTTSLTLCCVGCRIKCLWLPLLLFQFQLLSLTLSHALFNAPSFSLPLGLFPTRPDPPHSLSIPAPSLRFHLLISLSSFSARANPKVLSLSLSLIQPFLLPLIYDYACEY